jgi:hypothetical protein
MTEVLRRRIDERTYVGGHTGTTLHPDRGPLVQLTVKLNWAIATAHVCDKGAIEGHSGDAAMPVYKLGLASLSGVTCVSHGNKFEFELMLRWFCFAQIAVFPPPVHCFHHFTRFSIGPPDHDAGTER